MATPVDVAASAGGAQSLQLKNSQLQTRWFAVEHRQPASSAAVSGNTPRQGIFQTIGSDCQVTALGSPNQTVNVAPGGGLIARSGQSAYPFFNSATVNVPLDAAHATLPRIDVVYVAVLDGVQGDAATTLRFGVTTGTPAASPTVPAIPTTGGAFMALANIAVPSIATRSPNQVQSGDITDRRPSIGSFDGILTPLGGDSTADAGFRVGQYRDFQSAGATQLERWNGAGWDPVSFVGAWIPYTPTMSGMLNNAGTFTARYRRIGKAVWLNVKFVPAATANLGTGVPVVSLPFQATSAAAGLMAGTGRILDGSGNNRPLWPVANPGDTGMSLFGLNSSLVYVSPGSAGYSWGNSSELEITFGPYECV